MKQKQQVYVSAMVYASILMMYSIYSS